MSYKAGDIRHTIYIQENTTAGTTDANGNPATPVWVSLTENPLRAAKKGLTGRTFYAAAAAKSEDNILFVVRYNSVTKDITTSMQIVEGVEVYAITAPPVDVGDQRQWLEIHAKKVAVNGG